MTAMALSDHFLRMKDAMLSQLQLFPKNILKDAVVTIDTAEAAAEAEGADPTQAVEPPAVPAAPATPVAVSTDKKISLLQSKIASLEWDRIHMGLLDLGASDAVLVRSDRAVINQVNRAFRRVYLRDDLYNTGWVVDGDISNCMSCGVFLLWISKYHCRVCGDIVCESCSPYKAVVPHFAEEGDSRTCSKCFHKLLARSELTTEQLLPCASQHSTQSSASATTFEDEPTELQSLKARVTDELRASNNNRNNNNTKSSTRRRPIAAAVTASENTDSTTLSSSLRKSAATAAATAVATKKTTATTSRRHSNAPAPTTDLFSRSRRSASVTAPAAAAMAAAVAKADAEAKELAAVAAAAVADGLAEENCRQARERIRIALSSATETEEDDDDGVDVNSGTSNSLERAKIRLLHACIDGDGTLADKLGILNVLIEDYHTDANAIDPLGERLTSLMKVVRANQEHLGSFLITRGADALCMQIDSDTCPLSYALEHRYLWVLNEFELHQQALVLASNNFDVILRYFSYLHKAGLESKAADLISTDRLMFSTEQLNQLHHRLGQNAVLPELAILDFPDY